MNNPTISICIPSYNRAHCLVNMLQSLSRVKLLCGDDVEICISNNCSPDSTAQLLEEWQAKLPLKVVTQKENIGATRNSIEVTKLATGRWIHMIGDDDTVVPENYYVFVKSLKERAADTWVLAGVIFEDNEEKYLKGLPEGIIPCRSFRRSLLKTGLSRYSFIGQHVFPAAHLKSFHTLPPKAFTPWPHQGLFLRQLAGEGDVLVWQQPLVKQAGGGAVLFWKADDWASIQIDRLNIIKSARAGAGLRYRWFFDALLLKEIYGVAGLKNPVSWKIHEAATFNRNALARYGAFCCSLGLLSVATAPFLLAVVALRLLPVRLLDYIPFTSYLDVVKKRYALEKAKPDEFDGMKRKI